MQCHANCIPGFLPKVSYSFLPAPQYVGLICFLSSGLFSVILADAGFVKKAPELKMIPQSDPRIPLVVTIVVSVSSSTRILF